MPKMTLIVKPKELAILERCKNELSSMTSLESVLELRDQAVAIKSYMKARGDARFSQNSAACIAALADNGSSCVLVSDKMTTAHFPLGYEFERDVEKIVKITDTIYALISGDVLSAHEIIQTTKSKITGVGNVNQIADTIRGAYVETRRTRIIRTELEPRGLDRAVKGDR